jgi:predicted DNA-binding ribbon-helix-helix protein
MKSIILKRSVTFGGRKTSVSLEEAYWKALHEMAQRWHATPSELIEEINADRKEGNLPSAIRLFVLEVYQDRLRPPLEPPKSPVGHHRMVG